MFRVNLVTAGRAKEKYFAMAAEEYIKRLSRFCEFTVSECREVSEEEMPEDLALKKEGAEILKKLKGYVIVMTPEGKKTDSREFSLKLKDIKDKKGEVTFVIGSSRGLSPEVKSAADELMSVSDMTFPHSLFKVMLLEQIYRAFMIESGGKYHK